MSEETMSPQEQANLLIYYADGLYGRAKDCEEMACEILRKAGLPVPKSWGR